ncbi:MAG: hypothetical protein LBD70_07545, partial [Bifidobacteriaceae bacterium]|nr:hypothetical protein [Bifidobacteriaceae bacterium]
AAGPPEEAIFAAHGLRFGLAIGRAPARPAGGDATLVLAEDTAYVADLSGQTISRPPAGHEGLTLWSAGRPQAESGQSNERQTEKG